MLDQCEPSWLCSSVWTHKLFRVVSDATWPSVGVSCPSLAKLDMITLGSRSNELCGSPAPVLLVAVGAAEVLVLVLARMKVPEDRTTEVLKREAVVVARTEVVAILVVASLWEAVLAEDSTLR